MFSDVTSRVFTTRLEQRIDNKRTFSFFLSSNNIENSLYFNPVRLSLKQWLFYIGVSYLQRNNLFI